MTSELLRGLKKLYTVSRLGLGRYVKSLFTEPLSALCGVGLELPGGRRQRLMID
jgi:hypothetical protein